ncbi:MAG: hypothetical protein V1858_05275 [Candidatus Gottesmanbacteria bacterium]
MPAKPETICDILTTRLGRKILCSLPAKKEKGTCKDLATYCIKLTSGSVHDPRPQSEKSYLGFLNEKQTRDYSFRHKKVVKKRGY